MVTTFVMGGSNTAGIGDCISGEGVVHNDELSVCLIGGLSKMPYGCVARQPQTHEGEFPPECDFSFHLVPEEGAAWNMLALDAKLETPLSTGGLPWVHGGLACL